MSIRLTLHFVPQTSSCLITVPPASAAGELVKDVPRVNLTPPGTEGSPGQADPLTVKENHRTSQSFHAYRLKTIAPEHTGIPAMENSCFVSN